MSAKERRRLVVLAEVKEGKLSLAEAARVLQLSYRQVKRVWKRFQTSGDAGLVHRSRGRPGSRATPKATQTKILARYGERYADFGPTLAAEHLAKEGLEVDHETLRRMLIVNGLWKPGRPRQKHRQWRERKACFGQMVQLDGSHHDWFEGRRAKAVLMVMVDDATNRLKARFSEEETTHASYDVFEAWVQQRGVPQSIYADRDSIYRCERTPSVAEQIAGEEPLTQFGRAMEQLGVELILANSPQAKGRVERCNGVLQDRLVKEMRLRGISDLARANEYLEREFLPEYNRRFSKEPASPADVHQAKPRHLEEILSWEEERVVRKDWTLSWNNRFFQIDSEHENLALAGRRVLVRRLRNGTVQLVYDGQKLKWKELPTKPQTAQPEPRRVGRTRLIKPAARHPWRGQSIFGGKAFWKGVKAEGRAARRAAAAAGRGA
jgi:molybdenum-dependent DNA-binding transcriptional regulator ModE